MKKITILMSFIMLLSWQGMTQTTLYLTTSGGSYATEKWVDITDGPNGTGNVLWAQGNGTYGDGAGLVTDATFTIVDGTTYYINCYDKYDDSWDGTTYQIRTAPAGGGILVADNGGVSPDDGNNVDASSAWEIMDDERESSEAFSYMPAACLAPSALTATALMASSANLGWTENGTATTWNIEWDTTGFTPGTGTMITGTTTNPHNLTGLTASTTYQFYVQADCGGSGTSTWAGPFTFTTSCASVVAPWSEGFENAGLIPNCWRQGVANAEPWKFSNTGAGNHIGNNGTITGTTSSGAYFAWVDDSSPHSLATTLESPLIDVSGLTTPELSFYLLSNNETYTNVNFSIDVWDGAAWNTGFYTHNSNTVGGAWEKIIVNLSSLTITGPIQFRFIVDESNGTDFYDDVAIDDVDVHEAPSCIAPSMLAITNLMPASVDLGWTSAAGIWNIEWDTTGFTPTGTPNITGTTTNPHSLSGLTPNTSYQYYVQADCGGSGTSTWTGPFTFTTPCNVLSVPFTEGFETSSSTIGCWSQIQEVGTSNWTFATGSSGGAITTAQAGTRNARFVSMSGTNTPITKLISPTFDLTTLTTPELSFYYGQEFWSPDQNRLKVYYRTSGVSPWVEIFVDSTNIASWTKQTLTLPNPSNTYQIAFEGINNFGRANVIDEVEIKEAPSCLAPSNLNVLMVNPSDALVAWTENGTATLWQVQWGAAGFPLGTGVIDTTSNNPYMVAPLMTETMYSFYVRAVCGAGDSSSWVGPLTFMTPCIAPVISSYPWTENFDGETVPNLPCGWLAENANADANTWISTTAQSSSAPNALGVIYNSTVATDDWVFTPDLTLTGGQAYQLTFNYRAESATFPEKLKVMFGSAQNSASMTTLLFDSTNIINTTFNLATVVFTPPTTASYFIGFHAYSDANMWRIYVDDVTVDISTAVNTETANSTFSIYPNPNNGLFTLKNVMGEKANVEVLNMQGKVVYKNNINSNNQVIDLRENAKGVYFVNITSTNGVDVLKIIVQ